MKNDNYYVDILEFSNKNKLFYIYPENICLSINL